MTCPHAHDDGAYVLGALSPGERLEFERHLDGCAECTRSVRELAGLPGLLGRVDGDLLEQPQVADPVPPTLLPALSRAVHRGRRRRVLGVAGLATAAALVVAVTVTQVVRDDEPGTPAAGPPQPSSQPSSQSQSQSSSTVPVTTREMTPVGDVPVQARLSLEGVTWGTRLGLVCHYDAPAGYEPAVDYTMFVRTRDGRAQQVGSWRSVSGKTMHLSGATAATPKDIESVEVRTTGGRVVLKLSL